jgi:hypothetical protein
MDTPPKKKETEKNVKRNTLRLALPGLPLDARPAICSSSATEPKGQLRKRENYGFQLAEQMLASCQQLEIN